MKAFNANINRKLYLYKKGKKHPEDVLCKNRMSFHGLSSFNYRYKKEKHNGKKFKKVYYLYQF